MKPNGHPYPPVVIRERKRTAADLDHEYFERSVYELLRVPVAASNAYEGRRRAEFVRALCDVLHRDVVGWEVNRGK